MFRHRTVKKEIFVDLVFVAVRERQAGKNRASIAGKRHPARGQTVPHPFRLSAVSDSAMTFATRSAATAVFNSPGHSIAQI